MSDLIEGEAERISGPKPSLTLIERFIYSELRIKLVWGLRGLAFLAFAFWQPIYALFALVGAAVGYAVGWKHARKGWTDEDAPPFT